MADHAAWHAVCVTSSPVQVEGTSQSSPMVAGIFSLVTDHRLNAGLPPLGFLGQYIDLNHAPYIVYGLNIWA